MFNYFTGCPYIQNIDDGGLPTATGDGLYSGEENKNASFSVDVGNRVGDLGVKVEGKFSFTFFNMIHTAIFCINIVFYGCFMILYFKRKGYLIYWLFVDAYRLLFLYNQGKNILINWWLGSHVVYSFLPELTNITSICVKDYDLNIY